MAEPDVWHTAFARFAPRFLEIAPRGPNAVELAAAIRRSHPGCDPWKTARILGAVVDALEAGHQPTARQIVDNLDRAGERVSLALVKATVARAQCIGLRTEAGVVTGLGKGGAEEEHPRRDPLVEDLRRQGVSNDLLDEAVEADGPVGALDERVPAEHPDGLLDVAVVCVIQRRREMVRSGWGGDPLPPRGGSGYRELEVTQSLGGRGADSGSASHRDELEANFLTENRG